MFARRHSLAVGKERQRVSRGQSTQLVRALAPGGPLRRPLGPRLSRHPDEVQPPVRLAAHVGGSHGRQAWPLQAVVARHEA